MQKNSKEKMTLFVVKKGHARQLPNILNRMSKDREMLGLEDGCAIEKISGSVILTGPQGLFEQGLLACMRGNTILAGELAPYIASFLTSDFIPYTTKVRVLTPKEAGALF